MREPDVPLERWAVPAPEREPGAWIPRAWRGGPTPAAATAGGTRGQPRTAAPAARSRSWWMRVAVAVACALLYVASDLLLRDAALPRSHVIPWYPGAGLGLVAVVVGGAAAAVPLFLARVMLGYWAPATVVPLWVTVAEAIGVVGAYVVAGSLLRRQMWASPGVWRVRHAVWLVAAIVGGALLSAAASIGLRAVAAAPGWARAWADLLAFAGGDAAGGMVVTPLALFLLLPPEPLAEPSTAARGSPDEDRAAGAGRGRAWERAAQVVVVALTIAVGIALHARGGGLVLGYGCFLPLAWVALREGVRAAALVVSAYGLACGVSAVWLGLAPSQILESQLILLHLGLAGLLLGAARTAAIERETRYWHLLAVASEGIWRLDREGRTRYVNDRAAELLGHAPAELVGRPAPDLVLPSEAALVRALLDASLEDGAAFELTLVGRGGARRPALVRASAVRSAMTGEVVGTIATLTDRAEWQAVERRTVDAEQAREQAQVLLEAAFHGSQQGMLVVRASDGRVLDANAAWCALTGTPCDAVVGARFEELAFWVDAADAAGVLATLVAGPPGSGATRECTVAFRRATPDVATGAPGASGAEVGQAVLSAMPAVVHGATYVVLSCRDVTEQRRLEERNERLQRLEELGQLAGGIAHDFNNLLMVILSYAQLLQATLAARGQVEPGDLEEIARAARRGRELTRHLLALNRDRTVARRLVDLGAALPATVGMLRPLFGAGVALAIEVEDGLPPILVDPVQLDRVVLNLAVNAVDAMPDGGRLTIGARLVEHGPGAATPSEADLPAGRYVALAITDTGHGMDAATRARLFEPFFTTKGAQHGTGLGLAVVAGIARQSGAALRVRSAPGAGTTVTILWPVATPTPGDDAAEAAPVPGRTCVLVVEDDATVRQTVRRLLAQADYDSAEARDGQEALERLTTRWGPGHGPAVVVADLVMPHLSGERLAEALAVARPDLPIVLMSAIGRLSPAIEALPNVAGPLLRKPFDFEALTTRVRAALRHAASSAGAGVSTVE